MRRWVLLVLALAFAASVAGSASATTFSFSTCVSNTSATNCATGFAQLFVDVTAGPGANQISFTFTNVGGSLSSITDVYFDDGSLLGIASVINGTGVDFSQGATPGNLPAGNNASPPFVATAGFTADSNPAVQPNGVNPGETLTIVFDLVNGKTISDALDELASGAVRIGIHVQGFGDGGSESFVNSTSVPEPGTAALLALALVAIAGVRRRS